jgi:predicted phage tail protein
MAEESPQKDIGPQKRLTKAQAISVMVAGGALIVLAWFVPAEQGSALQMAKVAVGLVGFVALCLGSYYRP